MSIYSQTKLFFNFVLNTHSTPYTYFIFYNNKICIKKEIGSTYHLFLLNTLLYNCFKRVITSSSFNAKIINPYVSIPTNTIIKVFKMLGLKSMESGKITPNIIIPDKSGFQIVLKISLSKSSFRTCRNIIKATENSAKTVAIQAPNAFR